MRELNPRAWIPSLNRYATGYDDLYYHRQMNGEGEWWCYPAGEDEQLDVEIELPTGFKDKDGREIYQGDIVSEEFEYGSEKTKTIWQVMWCDDECALGLHYVSGFKVDDCSLYADDEEDYEVIGNIHENKELLEVNDVD